MSDYQLIMTTMPDIELAEKLAEELLESKLAACINILPPMLSVYRWQGKLEKGQEHQLMIKTRTACCEAVINMIQSTHPYELPEIITIPIISGLPAYLNWIHECTELQ